MESLIEYLDRNFVVSDIGWSGLPCQLTSDESGRKKAALALLQTLYEKWLPVIEYVGQSEIFPY
jgi:hypothetical protein